MAERAHTHQWSAPYRGQRWCNNCSAFQFHVDGMWRDRMRLDTFAEKWCPMVAGPEPEKMLTVEVALAFEWNSYESWDTVFRVRFDFADVARRTRTRTDIMNGWRSSWQEDFCQIDAEAEAYYKSRTQRDYDVGDNTYLEMRHFIQGVRRVAPQPLKLEEP